MRWRDWRAMRPGRGDTQAGFTLIEMLIAIAIFGIMSAVTYRVLSTVLETRGRAADEYGRWREVARAIASLERDFEAIRARPARDASGRLTPPLMGQPVVPPSGEPAIAFSRAGDPSASPPRRIGYRVHDGVLERLVWTGLDQAPRSVPTATGILSGVVDLAVRYRPAAGPWQAAWPPRAATGAASSHVLQPAAVDAALPAAVEVTIQLASGARIARLFPLTGGVKR
jgi:general secretion pathway protein J